MPSPTGDDRFERVVTRTLPGYRLRRAWPLAGGVSAEVTALEVERPDGIRETVLVRRHGPADLRHNPRIARDEYRLLWIARAHHLAVPRVFGYDESGDILPSPYIVLEYVVGEAVFDPADLGSYADQLAEHLARIHGVAATPALDFLPRLGRGFGEPPAMLDEELGEARIRDALERAWPLANENPATLLHGDYWPGNVLWRDGTLVAVIDWEDARIGDPIADVANCRLELAMTLGEDAVRAFTDAFRARSTLTFADLAYWDLVAALRPCGKLAGWGLDRASEERMRAAHARFVEQALSHLAR